MKLFARLFTAFNLLLATLAVVIPSALYAQTPADAGGLAGISLCLTYAPLIAIATTLLKQIPFIGKSPKAIAFVLSLATTFSPLFHGTALPVAQLVTCVLTQLAGAVATHEIALAPIGQAISSTS